MSPAQAEQHELLQELKADDDQWSQQRLTAVGLPPDARCLEVGAGTGTMAHWLASQVPDGTVTATEVQDYGIPPHPRLTILVPHDVDRDPIDGEYDLILARFVVAYRPDPASTIRKLTTALAPGGVLVVEEFDLGWGGVLDAPGLGRAKRLFDERTQVLRKLQQASGVNPDLFDLCWHVPRLMRLAGLVGVRADVGGARSWHGGEAGARNLRHKAAHFRAKLEVSAPGRLSGWVVRRFVDRLQAFETLMADPHVVVTTDLKVATTGCKPTTVERDQRR